MEKMFKFAVLIIAVVFMGVSQVGAQIDLKVSGRVIDASTGQPLAGANILIEQTGIGTASDANGYFELKVPVGNYVISASYIGYEVGKQRIVGQRDPITMEFNLRPRILPGQEVVITANRARERETPVAFVNLPGPELKQRYWAQDIPMLLAEVPGIYAYSDAGNGLGYTYLKIRGFDQKRVAVMINGIPLNDPEDHQVYWVDMPDFLASVEDIQIQRGVGSSLYGSSSFGGTVNIITTEMNQPRQIKIATGAGSYGTQQYRVQLHSGLIDNQYAVSARFSKILSDGYRQNSAVDMWAYFLSAARYGLKTTTFINVYGGPELTHASWEASPQSELKKNHRHNPITYPNAVDNFHQPHYELHHRWQYSDRLSWNNSLYYIHGKGYYEAFKTGQKLVEYGLNPFYLPDSTLVKRTDLVRQKWVVKDQVGWISRVDWSHPKGTLSLGFDGYGFGSDHYGKVIWAAQLPPGASPDNKYYQYLGKKFLATVFAHELYQLTPALSVMADLNLQWQRYDFKQQERGNFSGLNRHAYQVNYQFFNPRFGANYNITSAWNVFANIAVAHREPSDDDLFDIWQGPDDLGVAPLFGRADTVRANSGEIAYLKWRKPLTQPERLLDYELGLGYRGERFQMKLNGYWMNFHNEIVPYSQVDKDGFPIKGNADRTVHRGIEGYLALALTRQLELSTAFAFSQNYFARFNQLDPIYDADWNFIGTRAIKYDGKTIAGFPGTMANVRLKYAIGPITSYLLLQHIGRQYLDNNELKERSIPAYSLLNFHLSYQLSKALGLSGIRLSLWVNNLLDKTYETAGYYDSWAGENYLWPGARRNFFVGIETSL